MSLQDDINRLIRYITSLNDFELKGPDDPFPYNHMGATLSEAILQAGTNYSTVLKPRIRQGSLTD